MLTGLQVVLCPAFFAPDVNHDVESTIDDFKERRLTNKQAPGYDVDEFKFAGSLLLAALIRTWGPLCMT